MLKDTRIIRLDQGVGDNLIGIAVSGVIDKDVLPDAQGFQAVEYPSFPIRADHMGSDHAIALPGGIRRSVQPSDLVLQPGDIPVPILFLHANDGSLHFEHGNIQGQAGRIIGGAGGSIQPCYPARGEPGHRDKRIGRGIPRRIITSPTSAVPAAPATAASTTASPGGAGDRQCIGGGLVIGHVQARVRDQRACRNGVLIRAGVVSRDADHHRAG